VGIRVTGNHPFWVVNRGWTRADRLVAGDLVLSHTGEIVPVTDIFDNGEIEPVFNLEVADHHTYFVATLDGKHSALVHNAYNVSAATQKNVAEVASLALKNEKLMVALDGVDGTGQNYTREQQATIALAYQILVLGTAKAGYMRYESIYQATRFSSKLSEVQRNLTSVSQELTNSEAAFSKYNSVSVSAFGAAFGGTTAGEYGPGTGLDHAIFIARFLATRSNSLLPSQPGISENQRQLLLTRVQLADAVYGGKKEALPVGWKSVEVWDAATDSSLPRGFRAELFGNTATKTFILGFAGTGPSIADWINNIKQGLGLPAEQYETGINIARKAAQEVKAGGGTLEIVGHSLGGGIATAAAIALGGVPATTFNPAGVHPNTVAEFGGLDNLPSPINAFVIRGELLTTLQNDNSTRLGRVMPDTVGSTNSLDAETFLGDLAGLLGPFGTGERYSDSFFRHLLGNFYKALAPP
jgi:Pretoxin HINT domain